MLPHTFIFEPSQTESSYPSIKEKGHLMNKFFTFAAITSIFMIGCNSGSVTLPPENVQMRMDFMGFLREMNDRQQPQRQYIQEIITNADGLTENETDKEKLVSLAKELLKAKGEDVSRLCVEMGPLMPLGEGYENYYPKMESAGGSVGIENQQ